MTNISPATAGQKEYMTEDELFSAADYLNKYGGHFASKIGAAFFYADSGNRKLLLGAFMPMFEEALRHHQQTTYLKD